MAVKKRYLAQFIKKDLRSKMVFLTGPRQVGKTTLSLSILSQKQANETHPAYLNWDDTADRKKQGVQFENLMACQLLKYCHFIEDTQGYKMELRFIRDTDKREIDFVVLKQKKPIFAVECKTKACAIAKTMHYFKERTSIPKFYQVHLIGDENYEDNGIRALPFNIFCKELKLP